MLSANSGQFGEGLSATALLSLSLVFFDLDFLPIA